MPAPMRREPTGRGKPASTSHMRPTAPTPVALGIVGIGLALALVARTTAAGWLTVLLSGLAGVLVVGAAWPALNLARVGIDVSAPRDGTVGRPLAISLTVLTSAPVTVSILEFGRRRFAVTASQAGDAVVEPGRRGVLESLTIEVRCAAPLGVFGWMRRVTVVLTPPAEIGPAVQSVPTPWRSVGGGSDEDAALPGRVGGDLVRGVRDYQPGDPPKLVAWAASARSGTLMVRELESPSAPRVTVVVDLRGEPAARESAASRAAGLAGAALADGFDVEMATAERDGPVLGPVATPVEIGRRLARAVPGTPPSPPPDRFVVAVGCSTESADGAG